MSSTPKILVAGIGNIFLGDDAFGVRVAEKLMRRDWPAGVRIVDSGIRGLDLAYTLLDGWDAAVLIDAVPRGEQPGTLFAIEPELPDSAAAEPVAMEGHSMDPVKVLQLVRAMGGELPRMVVVGCEPTPLDEYADMQSDLSPAAQAAIEPAAAMVESIVESIRADLLERYSHKEQPHVHSHIASQPFPGTTNP